MNSLFLGMMLENRE